MGFGTPVPKIRVAIDFIAALAQSAFRLGDSVGMSAFDTHERMDLFVPATLSRGMGVRMTSLLRDCEMSGRDATGLGEAAARIGGRAGLIFIVSDFHWPLERLEPVLDIFAHSYVVPLVVWDPAEIAPPAHSGLLPVWDGESQSQRTLWVRPKLRARWREAVAKRRAAAATRCSTC